MSREIKFRAFEIDSKEMFFPSTDNNNDYFFSGFSEGHLKVSTSLYSDDVDYVLMQYTGLKDKNGVEIYEGNVVNFVGDRKGNRVVEYKNEEACFIARNLIGTGYLEPVYLNDVDFEVIGNIYENPELLEVAQ